GVLKGLDGVMAKGAPPVTPPAAPMEEHFDWSEYRIPGEFFSLPTQRTATAEGRELISLVKGTPDPHLFPFDKIKQIAQNMVWNPKDYFFQYGHPQGFQPLVEHLEQRMALEGVAMQPGSNDIVLTAGFQRAMDLLVDWLCREGDVVVVEQPTYASILNLLIARKVNYVGVPVDREGLQVTKLEQVLEQQKNIKAIITIPTCHNPTGITMSLERREQLLDLAMRFGVPIIEDDYALDLRFDGPKLPSLKALDRYGIVLHVGSYSKAFLPGLRIGWVTAPSEAALALVRLKRAADHGDSFFLQAFLHEFIKRGYYDQHVRHVCRIYQSRRDALIEALEQYLPPGVTFTRPQGGMALWVNLPPTWESMPIYHLAREEGVEIAVARFFWPGKQDAPGFRIAYSLNPETTLKEGARRLGQALTRLMEEPALYKEYQEKYQEL
ncbi:MAG TPA: PLP-dependent aminotransferase family protein, partial [bacterium]|nr:PLP-dependent aminotransferase family protein [bacterium]